MLALHERRYEDALAAFPTDMESMGDAAARLKLRLLWGNACLGAGHNREAREIYFEIYRGVRHSKREDLRETGLKALMNAGLATKNLGETKTAIQFYKAVLAQDLLDQPRQEMRLRNLLGSLYTNCNEPGQAAEQLQRSLTLAIEHDEQAAEADIRLNLAGLAFHLKDLAAATEHLERSRELAGEDQERRLRVEINMGTMLCDQQMWDKAWIFFDKAQDLARKNGIDRYLPLILANQARIRQKQNLHAESRELAGEALERCDGQQPDHGWVRECCREILQRPEDESKPDDFSLAEALITQHDMVAVSASMRRILRDVEALSASDLPVLVQGETGTGKELVARALHAAGPRKDSPFVPVNCPAIPEPLFESTLFGHLKGAFTGADHDRPGLVELAGDGSLFLDEIGDLPMSIQPKLLRFLESGEYQRMGSGDVLYSNARIISATNRNLVDLSRHRQFREDLVMRISAFRVELPPLRERREDIYFIANSLIEKLNRQHGRRKTFSGEALKLINSHPFPGNVRELRNAVLRGYQIAQTEIDAPDLGLPADLPPIDEPGVESHGMQGRATVAGREDEWLSGLLGRLSDNGEGNLEDIMADLEMRLIRKALVFRQGDRQKTAEDLGLSFRALKYKITKYGIKSRKGRLVPEDQNADRTRKERP